MKFSFTKPKGACKEGDMRVDYAPSRRIFPWARWYLILLLVLCPLFFFLYRVVTPWFFVDSPAVISMEQALVTMPKTGRVVAVETEIDARVHRGDVLFRIEDDASDAKRDELVMLRTQLALLGTGGSRVPGVSRGAIETAKASLANRRNVRRNIEELYRKGAATQAELNQALDDESRAMSALVQLQDARRSAAASGSRSRFSAEQERVALEERIGLLEKAIAEKDVTCPIDGQVLDVYVSGNETLTQGASLAIVVNPDRARIIVFADTKAFPFIRDNAVARVSLPGGKRIEAYVEHEPLLVQTLPGGIMEFAGGKKVMRVRLVPAEPIPREYLIEGLPLSVRWGFSFPTTLKRVAKN